jgi:hypothetical protein
MKTRSRLSGPVPEIFVQLKISGLCPFFFGADRQETGRLVNDKDRVILIQDLYPELRTPADTAFSEESKPLSPGSSRRSCLPTALLFTETVRISETV